MAASADMRLEGRVLVAAIRACPCGIGQWTPMPEPGVKTTTFPPKMRDCPFCGRELHRG